MTLVGYRASIRFRNGCIINSPVREHEAKGKIRPCRPLGLFWLPVELYRRIVDRGLGSHGRLQSSAVGREVAPAKALHLACRSGLDLY